MPFPRGYQALSFTVMLVYRNIALGHSADPDQSGDVDLHSFITVLTNMYL